LLPGKKAIHATPAAGSTWTRIAVDGRDLKRHRAAYAETGTTPRRASDHLPICLIFTQSAGSVKFRHLTLKHKTL